jgi:hypothetical protein
MLTALYGRGVTLYCRGAQLYARPRTLVDAATRERLAACGRELWLLACGTAMPATDDDAVLVAAPAQPALVQSASTPVVEPAQAEEVPAPLGDDVPF